MKYKNIVFDLYGTLIDIHTDELGEQTWKLFADYLRSWNVDYEALELKELFFHYDLSYRNLPSKHKVPEIEILDVFDQILQKKGQLLTREQIAQIGYRFRCISREYIRLFDGVINLLTLLHEHDCNVFLLSNAQSSFTRPEISMLHLDEYFDRIIISSDHGCMKPDPDFFYQLFQNRNEIVDVKDWIMIGDSISSDIMGADSIGMDSILLCNESEPEEKLPVHCIATVRGRNRMQLFDYLS